MAAKKKSAAKAKPKGAAKKAATAPAPARAAKKPAEKSAKKAAVKASAPATTKATSKATIKGTSKAPATKAAAPLVPARAEPTSAAPAKAATKAPAKTPAKPSAPPAVAPSAAPSAASKSSGAPKSPTKAEKKPKAPRPQPQRAPAAAGSTSDDSDYGSGLDEPGSPSSYKLLADRILAAHGSEDGPGALRSAVEGEETEVVPDLPPVPAMPARLAEGVVTIAHGPGPEQHFMLHGLGAGKVNVEDRRYAFHREELHVLEERAALGEPDVVLFSAGAYAKLYTRYLLLPCGGGFGDQRGPALVARTPIRAGEVRGLDVAVPSLDHPAAVALRLWLPTSDLRLVPMPIAHISLMVRADKIRSGVLVNEDQVDYRRHRLVRVVDLGHWWGDRTEGLPMPTHVFGIRRDIPQEQRTKIALDMKRSIAYGLGHREEALDAAMRHAAKHERKDVDDFISRYVNDMALDSGERGRQALRRLYAEAARLKVFDAPPSIYMA